jgi:hypothetical protein
VAAVLAAPNLLWQAANGWPQIEMGRQIAAGSSGTSADRGLVVPLQLLQVGPLLGIVLVAGLVALLRAERWRPHRWIGVAYLVLLVIVIVTGGKPYYSGGLMLPLLAAGVPWVLRLAAGRTGRVVVGALLAVHVIGSAILVLPVATPSSPLTAFANGPNPDLGETVGWDRFSSVVRSAAATHAVDAVVTSNYGEAGAVDRARRRGVPGVAPVYSGHNAYGEWGPPPESARDVASVGRFDDARLASCFARCGVVARIDNGYRLENEEQGAPVRVCQGRRAPWSDIWPQLRHLG